MTRDEFVTLLDLVRTQLRQIGAPELAEEQSYTRASTEGAERLVPDPRTELIEMLEAFERFVASRDRSVAEGALTRLRRIVPRGPIGIRMSFPFREDSSVRRDSVDLLDAPNLETVRKLLRKLLGDLRETPMEYE